MKDTEIHGEGNVWSTAHREERDKFFVVILVLNKTIDQLTMANSVHWYCHV